MRIEGIACAALRAWDTAVVQVPAAGARPCDTHELRGGALTGRRSVAMDIACGAAHTYLRKGQSIPT